MAFGELRETAEKYLGRIHLVWWIISEVSSVLTGAMTGWVARIQGWDWFFVVPITVGTIVITFGIIRGFIFLIGRLPWPRYVSLRHALQIAYTECEQTPYGKLISARHADPDKRLQFLFNALTSAKGVHLFAKQPPSTQRRQIDTDEGLSWVPGTNDVSAVFSERSPAYTDAAVKRSELRSAIKELRNIDPG